MYKRTPIYLHWIQCIPLSIYVQYICIYWFRCSCCRYYCRSFKSLLLISLHEQTPSLRIPLIDHIFDGISCTFVSCSTAHKKIINVVWVLHPSLRVFPINFVHIHSNKQPTISLLYYSGWVQWLRAENHQQPAKLPHETLTRIANTQIWS